MDPEDENQRGGVRFVGIVMARVKVQNKLFIFKEGDIRRRTIQSL